MSDDLIKRSDAIKAIKGNSYDYDDYIEINGYGAIEDIRALPSAGRPEGEWIPFEYGDERWHKCTACGVADRYIEYVERPNGTTGKLVAIRNYCPNCGARMTERSE